MNQDIEKGLLGIALTGGDVDALAQIIQPQDFWSPTHEYIWRAIIRVHDSGDVPDPITTRKALAELAPDYRIDPILLTDLVGMAPVTTQGEWYAGEVYEQAGRRRILSAADRLRQIGESESISLAEAREKARSVVDDATAGRSKSPLVKMADIVARVVDAAEGGISPTLPTGWDDLDRLIGGLAPGRLVVIGARPGVGKSVMGTNLALEFAERHKHAVLMASMEMDQTEVGQRLVAARARVNLGRLMNGGLMETEWDKIRDSYDAISALPIAVRDEAHQTVTGIRSAAREVKRERDDLALIVVDYLQQMDPGISTPNRAEQVGHISRGLKILARELNTCVVAMAQVNREGTKHGDGRPKMSDLRESGSIEADADQVILLHRPSEETPDLEAIVDKNRHGPKGIATLQIEGHYARISNAHWSPSRKVA